jgi:hypothetical protein
MKEIILEFKNYKLLKNEKFDLSNYMVYCFEGRNGIGKSSAITGLEELISAMSFTVQPVSGGEKEGWKKVVWKGVDGKLYTIEHTFDVKNGKGKFVAYNDKAEQITSVTKIRELLGTYSRITVDQFFEMAKKTEGRRKLIDEYFNKLLTAEERTEIQTNRAYEGRAYEQRTQYGRDIKAIEPLLKELTEEEEKVVARIPEAKEKVTLRRKQLEDIKEAEFAVRNLMGMKDQAIRQFDSLNTTLMTVLKEEDIKVLRNEFGRISESISSMIEKVGKDLPNKEELVVMIERAEGIIERGAALHAMKSQYVVNKEKFDNLNTGLEKLETEITTRRNRVVEIYTNSKLPAGITINEDSFSFHGYDFSKEQVSESEAKLAIAELMCQIDTAGLIVLGNASVFGKERMDQICEIAKKYNKKVFLERVIDDLDEVRLVGIVDVSEVKEPNEVKESKPKSNGKKQKAEPKTESKPTQSSTEDEPL